MAEFSHYNAEGRSQMVDVSPKAVTARSARASGFVRYERGYHQDDRREPAPQGKCFLVLPACRNNGGQEKLPPLIPLCIRC